MIHRKRGHEAWVFIHIWCTKDFFDLEQSVFDSQHIDEDDFDGTWDIWHFHAHSDTSTHCYLVLSEGHQYFESLKLLLFLSNSKV